MIALVLAAGLGTRLKPLTDTIAKSAIPFLGIPLIHYSLYLLYKNGVRHFIINTHYIPESVVNAVKKFQSRYINCKIEFVHESEILGSGGPHFHLKQFRQPFIVCNSDNFFLLTNENDFTNFLNQKLNNQRLGSFFCCNHREVNKSISPLWSDKNGNLVKIGFNKSIQDTPLHFTGIRLLHPNILKFTPNKKNQSLFPDIIQPSLNQGKEYNLYKSSLLWQELGNPLDLKNSENLMKKILNHSCDYNSELIYTLEKSEFNQSALYFKKQISDYLNFFR